jgi:DNA-binding transcriptional MerR regulator
VRVWNTRDAATLVGLRPAEVRALARVGALEPARSPGGAYRFDFRDLVLLRAAAGLRMAGLPLRRVAHALHGLRSRLPADRSLSALRIVADGDDVLVRDGTAAWNPRSDQLHFDFGVAEVEARIAPLRRRHAPPPADEPAGEAEYWFELGVSFEPSRPDEAERAYRRAVELEPGHADAHVNLGRLLHERGEARAATTHYRRALVSLPTHATAAFNLGVALEDLRRPAEATHAYERAIALNPRLADAHFNLAGLLQSRGDRQAALRHYRRYRDLTGGSDAAR